MTKKTKAFCCWSGGKESALALYKAQRSKMDIAYLVNMVSVDGKHSRSHGVSAALLKIQAQALGIPIVQRKTTWETYEEEFKKAVSELKTKGIDTGIFGDIDLQQHRDWVERVCKDVDIKPILPLWKEKRENLLKEFIDQKFKAIVVATDASSLGKEWLGRQVDNEFVKDINSLKKVDLCGEEGEYHSLVYNGPIFKGPIELIFDKKIFKDKHWFLELKFKNEH
ncbi:diphthine--ammonia ligase [Patescibacteria group bacterium]|nr:diphthine--ammonia ligase [Patescibacteria group bacterium]